MVLWDEWHDKASGDALKSWAEAGTTRSIDPAAICMLMSVIGIFANHEMGSGATLHGTNPERLMSALGQKRTSHQVRVMSALP
jgi:hypothetical protein